MKKKVDMYESLNVEEVNNYLKNGIVICEIINRYRKDIIEFNDI